MRTIRDALHHGAARLQTAGIESPRLEARLLLAHALGNDVAALLRDQDRTIHAPRYEALLSRRAAREPLALIVGHREFWSLDFEVSPATLIPRPDSETLIKAALDAIAANIPPPLVGQGEGLARNDRPPPPDPIPQGEGGCWPMHILDLGTGTGCLLLAILSELSGSFGIGVDRLPAAAALAARNAAMLGMGGRTAFLCGDWAAALNRQFDLVLCNPPYIATGDLNTLMPDVACYEPVSALDGGPDGYAAYRRIIPELGRLLTARGIAVLETGLGQADDVARMARRDGFTSMTHADLSGIARALVLRRSLP